jgi:hypothetical protein
VQPRRRHTPMQCSHAVGIRRCSAATPSAYADHGRDSLTGGPVAAAAATASASEICARQRRHKTASVLSHPNVRRVRAGSGKTCDGMCECPCVRACVRVRGLVYPRGMVRHHRAPRYTTRHGMPQGKCRPVVPPAHRGAISIGVTIASHSVRSNAQPCHCTPDRTAAEWNPTDFSRGRCG